MIRNTAQEVDSEGRVEDYSRQEEKRGRQMHPKGTTSHPERREAAKRWGN